MHLVGLPHQGILPPNPATLSLACPLLPGGNPFWSPSAPSTCRLQVSTIATFYCSAGAGVVGCLLTWFFLPDTTGGWAGGWALGHQAAEGQSWAGG